MICKFCHVDRGENEFPPKPKGPYPWMCRSCERNRASVRKHGITVQQKAEVAENQGGCAICGHPEPGVKGWVVDHDHACCSGEKSCPKCRRGVLCQWCNMVLANAFDRPQILQSAVEYLAAHALGTCDWHMPLACEPGICGKSAAA